MQAVRPSGTRVPCIVLIVAASLAPWFETAAQAQEAPSGEGSAEPGPAAPPPAENPPPPPSVPPPSPPAPPPLVAAPPPRDPRFGDPGQVVFDGTLSASIGHLGYSAGSATGNTFSVEPAFDYFSTSNFSQGVSAFFRYTDNASGLGSDVKTSSFGVNGQVGVNLWLGDRVSFWPKLGLGALVSRTTYSPTPASGTNVSVGGKTVPLGSDGEVTTKAIFVQVYAPFLFHVTQHLFVGLGPNAYADVLDSSDGVTNLRRSLGASSTVGGWF